jgi:MFS family permease
MSGASEQESLSAQRSSPTWAADTSDQECGWGGLLLIYVLCVLGASSISQAIPVAGDIARVFHATHAQVGWVISIPSAVGAIAALLLGWIVDRYGDKPLLIAGCVLMLIGDVGVVWADDLTALFLARIVEGTGYICIAVSTVTMVARTTRGKRRVFALTLWSSFVPMSFAVPLVLAGLVAGPAHWHWAFLGHAALVAVLGLAALSLPAWHAESAVVRRTQGLGEVLRIPGPYALGFAFACGAFVQTGLISTLPQVLTAKYAIPFALASLVGTVGMLSNIAGCLSMGPLITHGISVLKLIFVSVGIALGAALILALAPLPLWVVVVVSLMFFYGAGLVVGFWALLPLVAPSESSRGATSGLVTQLTLLGVLLGPPAAFAAHGFGTQQAINAIVGWAPCALLLVLAVRRSTRATSGWAAPSH